MTVAIVKLVATFKHFELAAFLPLSLLLGVLRILNYTYSPSTTCWQVYLLSSVTSVQPLSNAVKPPDVTEKNTLSDMEALPPIPSDLVRQFPHIPINSFRRTLADETTLVPRLTARQLPRVSFAATGVLVQT